MDTTLTVKDLNDLINENLQELRDMIERGSDPVIINLLIDDIQADCDDLVGRAEDK